MCTSCCINDQSIVAINSHAGTKTNTPFSHAPEQPFCQIRLIIDHLQRRKDGFCVGCYHTLVDRSLYCWFIYCTDQFSSMIGNNQNKRQITKQGLTNTEPVC